MLRGCSEETAPVTITLQPAAVTCQVAVVSGRRLTRPRTPLPVAVPRGRRGVLLRLPPPVLLRQSPTRSSRPSPVKPLPPPARPPPPSRRLRARRRPATAGRRARRRRRRQASPCVPPCGSGAPTAAAWRTTSAADDALPLKPAASHTCMCTCLCCCRRCNHTTQLMEIAETSICLTTSTQPLENVSTRIVMQTHVWLMPLAARAVCTW